MNKIQFPLYKLRSYLNIEKNPLGLVKITTIKGEKIKMATILSELDKKKVIESYF